MEKSAKEYQEAVQKALEHFNIEDAKEFGVLDNNEKTLKAFGIGQMLDTIAIDAKRKKIRIIIDYDPDFPKCIVRGIGQ